jgi:hypothetical protein
MRDRLHQRIGRDNDRMTKNALDSAVRNMVGKRRASAAGQAN